VLYQITEVHDVADPKKEEFKSSKDDGVFISRRLRRQAEATAKAEAEKNKQAEEDALDAAEQADYDADPKNAAKTNAQKTVDAEQAHAQATADARKKFGLK